MAERDVTKLPKWAQDRIQTLEHNVEFWKAKATAGPEDSNTFVNEGLDNSTPIGKGPTIRFQAGDHWSDRLDVRLERDGRMIVMGTDQLHICPYSSNVVYITQERRG